MMHNSRLIFDSQIGKQTRNEKKQHVKSDGLYFLQPLTQKLLSVKKHAQVYKSCINEYGGKQSQYLHLQYQKNIKLSTVKKISIKQLGKQCQKIKTCFRFHYRANIKNYLKRAYNKPVYEIPLEAFQALRCTSKQENSKKTDLLVICKPFYFRGNLKNFLLQKQSQYGKKILKKGNIFKLLHLLLKCSLEFGGLDDFIMTAENIYLDFTQDSKNIRFFINYTSFTGLTLIKAKQPIGSHQFVQISAYLTPQMLNTGKIGIGQKIRFFLINSLAILRKNQMTLANSQVQQSKQYTFNQIYDLIIKKQQTWAFQDKVIDFFKKQIQQLKKKQSNKIQYQQFYIILQKVLVLNQKITWQQILKCICKKFQKNKKKSKIKRNIQSKQISEINKIQKKYHCQQKYKWQNKIQQGFKYLHQCLYLKQQNKKFYQQRNIQSQLLYIPIKFQADLTLIFKHKAWWDVFDNKFCLHNNNNSEFAFRVLDAAISRYLEMGRGQQQAKNFKQDIVIETLFNYLKLADEKHLIKFTTNQNNINFLNIFNKYKQLVNYT